MEMGFVDKLMCFLMTLVLAIGTCVLATDITIEAENMFGEGHIITRARASGRRVVHLYSGEKLRYEMCLMSTTSIRVGDVMYSNDGGSDKVHMTMDHSDLGVFDTRVRDDGGLGWNSFVSAEETFPEVHISEGRHLLTMTVLEADEHGVELDHLTLTMNTTQSLDSVSCRVFCFDDISYGGPLKVANMSLGKAEQRSTVTACAEEDNVNIPVYHSSAESFTVSASLPKYRSFLNSRDPDWTNCPTAHSFWNFTNLNPGLSNSTIRSLNAQLSMNIHPGFMLDSSYLGTIDIVFSLNGPSTGHTDSEIGTIVFLKNIQFSGTVSFQFEFFSRFNSWSAPQRKTVKGNADELTFDTPDFTFREGNGNRVRISIFSEQGIFNSLSIGEFYMKNRYIQPDQNKKIYDDGITVIEAVDIDMWWRINETMTVSVMNPRGTLTFDGVDYIRVYRRIPWSNNAFAQIFVMYQDGNIRLLPITPHGLDWIPFGSSVILGQTDPVDVRPSASISHINIVPEGLTLTIFYTDGGVVTLNIEPSFEETKLIVHDCTYARDLSLFPFFTFRSMYVGDGNSDVDHISSGDASVRILDKWDNLYGHFFSFYRKCISKHNTLSPDITLDITK